MTASWKQHENIWLSPMARVIPNRVRKIQEHEFSSGCALVSGVGVGIKIIWQGSGLLAGAMTATGLIVIIV